ncbi:MAG: AraC family transcriptional regulator [Leadbetterella sp.]|nr:AraC family transcriptional regulator [Leadbetterella sp.]
MVFSILNMSLFGKETASFWMGRLSGLLQSFPRLEVPHKQDFYMILLVEEGEGTVTVDHHTLPVDGGKAIIIRPHTVSGMDIKQGTKGKVICFTDSFFSMRYNDNVLNRFSFMKMDAQPCIWIPGESRERWNMLLGLLSEEFRQNETEQAVMRSYLNIILFELERFYNPAGFVKAINLKQEKIYRFEQLILRYLDTKKLPSDYAELLNITPNYLNRICKEETGNTAGGLIRKQVDSEARRMLKHTHLSINEIADTLGFDSTSYFVTFFKKQTGITPEQFRKSE